MTITALRLPFEAATSPLSSLTATAVDCAWNKNPLVGYALGSLVLMASALGTPSPTAKHLEIPSYAAKAPSDTHRQREDLRSIARIRELGAYEDGWNGADTLGPTPQTVEDAERFMRALDSAHTHLPFITLTDDGEINFYWKLAKVTIDLGFFGDKTYSYFARTADGKIFRADNQPLTSPLPSDLQELMRKSA